MRRKRIGITAQGIITQTSRMLDAHAAMVERKGRSKSESYEQELVVQYLQWMQMRHHSIPNGGKRSLAAAAKLKREGLSPGAPDLFIPIPIRPHHGLYIEMKRKKGGVVSPEQKDWITYLNKVGYVARVANGHEAALKIIKDYFAGEIISMRPAEEW